MKNDAGVSVTGIPQVILSEGLGVRLAAPACALVEPEYSKSDEAIESADSIFGGDDISEGESCFLGESVESAKPEVYRILASCNSNCLHSSLSVFAFL